MFSWSRGKLFLCVTVSDGQSSCSNCEQRQTIIHNVRSSSQLASLSKYSDSSLYHGVVYGNIPVADIGLVVCCSRASSTSNTSMAALHSRPERQPLDYHITSSKATALFGGACTPEASHHILCVGSEVTLFCSPSTFSLVGEASPCLPE